MLLYKLLPESSITKIPNLIGRLYQVVVITKKTIFDALTYE